MSMVRNGIRSTVHEVRFNHEDGKDGIIIEHTDAVTLSAATTPKPRVANAVMAG